MNILSVDLSANHFGYSIFKNGKWIESDSREYSKLKKQGEYKRHVFIYDFFHSLINKHEIDITISEQFFANANVKTYGILQMCQGMLMLACEKNNCVFKEINIKAYRKKLGIKANKSALIKIEVAELFVSKYNVINDKESDIADSLALYEGYLIMLQDQEQ